jgi:hypothetical protein
MPTSGICRLPSGRLVVDDHDVIDEQHAGPDGHPGPPGEVLGPRDGLRAELEGVEVHVAETEHRRPELVAARPALLHDHAVLDERADDPVGGGRGQVQPAGQLRQAHATRSLERGEHADRTVDGLDHRCGLSVFGRRHTKYAEESCASVNRGSNVHATFDNIE